MRHAIIAKHKNMKFIKSRINPRTRHNFDLAGHPASIRASFFDLKFGIVGTEIRVGVHIPISAGFFGIVTKDEIKMRLRDLANSRKLGIKRPDVNLGDIVESGEHNFAQAVQVLCLQTGLDPEDCTDYDYVDLSVRAAAVALARKMTLVKRMKTAGYRAVRPTPSKEFDPFML